jgi:hypothetical protein
VLALAYKLADNYANAKAVDLSMHSTSPQRSQQFNTITLLVPNIYRVAVIEAAVKDNKAYEDPFIYAGVDIRARRRS